MLSKGIEEAKCIADFVPCAIAFQNDDTEVDDDSVVTFFDDDMLTNDCNDALEISCQNDLSKISEMTRSVSCSPSQDQINSAKDAKINTAGLSPRTGKSKIASPPARRAKLTSRQTSRRQMRVPLLQKSHSTSIIGQDSTKNSDRHRRTSETCRDRSTSCINRHSNRSNPNNEARPSKRRPNLLSPASDQKASLRKTTRSSRKSRTCESGIQRSKSLHAGHQREKNTTRRSIRAEENNKKKSSTLRRSKSVRCNNTRVSQDSDQLLKSPSRQSRQLSASSRQVCTSSSRRKMLASQNSTSRRQLLSSASVKNDSTGNLFAHSPHSLSSRKLLTLSSKSKSRRQLTKRSSSRNLLIAQTNDNVSRHKLHSSRHPIKSSSRSKLPSQKSHHSSTDRKKDDSTKQSHPEKHELDVSKSSVASECHTESTSSMTADSNHAESKSNCTSERENAESWQESTGEGDISSSTIKLEASHRDCRPTITQEQPNLLDQVHELSELDWNIAEDDEMAFALDRQLVGKAKGKQVPWINRRRSSLVFSALG